jgi:hypothetical protein
MYNFVVYFYEVASCWDITYLISHQANTIILPNEQLSTSKDLFANENIVNLINYKDLTIIFLLGLITSLCGLTYCCSSFSKKKIPKYVTLQGQPINNILSV